MRPPSLYSYFDSKHAIYDAMFLQGNLDLLARYEAVPEHDDPVEALRVGGRLFVQFGVGPARAQLLFMRTIPGSTVAGDIRRRCANRCAEQSPHEAVRDTGRILRPVDIGALGRRLAADRQRARRGPMGAVVEASSTCSWPMSTSTSTSTSTRRGEAPSERDRDAGGGHRADQPPREGWNSPRPSTSGSRSMLQQLQPGDWSRQTVCTDWNVKQLVAHVLGFAESNASFRVFVNGMRNGKKRAARGLRPFRARHERGPGRGTGAPHTRLNSWTDGPRSGQGPQGPQAVPAVHAAHPCRVRAAHRQEADGFIAIDVVFTRDTWMHRIDVCRAVGLDPVLTPGHDERLIEDMVAEWAASMAWPSRSPRRTRWRHIRER